MLVERVPQVTCTHESHQVDHLAQLHLHQLLCSIIDHTSIVLIPCHFFFFLLLSLWLLLFLFLFLLAALLVLKAFHGCELWTQIDPIFDIHQYFCLFTVSDAQFREKATPTTPD